MSTNPNKNKKHTFFMKLALKQAMINLGNTAENPSVGCVIAKNNSLISSGCTSIKGRPHAEYNAIINSKEKISNSDLYITLEPCSHYGKTAPCVNKIIKQKVRRVYFSINDPDIRSFNKSKYKFLKNKINVNKGLYSNRIREFYKSYILYKENNLPFVTCKLAISKDFYSINKKKEWITNRYSRGRVHLMRSMHDSIITSSNTVKIDNPRLNCRINGLEKRSPTRVLLDHHLKISIKSNVIKNSNKYKTIIFYNKENKKKIKLLKKLGIKTHKIPVNDDGNFNLKKVLFKLSKLGFSRIFLECGIKLSHSFLKENLVNDLKIFISDKKLKKNGKGSIKYFFNTFLKRKKYISEKVNLFNERLITYKIK